MAVILEEIGLGIETKAIMITHLRTNRCLDIITVINQSIPIMANQGATVTMMIKDKVLTDIMIVEQREETPGQCLQTTTRLIRRAMIETKMHITASQIII